MVSGNFLAGWAPTCACVCGRGRLGYRPAVSEVGATLKRTAREFRQDNLTDWAAALTYYAVLSIFPALVVFVAIVGLVGPGPADDRRDHAHRR